MNRSELTNSQLKPTDERVTRIEVRCSWLVDIVIGDLECVRLTGGVCAVCAQMCAHFETVKSQQPCGFQRCVLCVRTYFDQSSI
jgi:hypothetical protein